MLDPSRYVQRDIAVFASLGTGTAASLYEICTRYLTNFGGLTNKETWEWWRPRLTGGVIVGAWEALAELSACEYADPHMAVQRLS